MVAFAFGEEIVLRRGSASILTDAVHEGKHALDFTAEYFGPIQDFERRAWLAEREFLSRLNLPLDHPTQRELMLDIWAKYNKDEVIDYRAIF